MTDIRRTRLADALADHMMVESSCLCGEDDFTFADDWGRHLADVLLSLPGMAIVDGDLADDLQAMADDVRGDIKQARADDDKERRSYLRGELQGLLQAYDLVTANAAVLPTEREGVSYLRSDGY